MLKSDKNHHYHDNVQVTSNMSYTVGLIVLFSLFFSFFPHHNYDYSLHETDNPQVTRSISEVHVGESSLL